MKKFKSNFYTNCACLVCVICDLQCSSKQKLNSILNRISQDELKIKNNIQVIYTFIYFLINKNILRSFSLGTTHMSLNAFTYI
jgi:hypothetical protein